MRLNERCALTATVGTGEEPGSCGYGNAAHRALCAIVGQADASIIKDGAERGPIP
jgi:hypothetical protein